MLPAVFSSASPCCSPLSPRCSTAPRSMPRNSRPPCIHPNPLAPVLKTAAPYGVQRGTTVDVTLIGTNLTDPTGVWTSFPSKVTIPTDGKNGKEAGKLVVKLEVPKDAPLGFQSLRLATARYLQSAILR